MPINTFRAVLTGTSSQLTRESPELYYSLGNLADNKEDWSKRWGCGTHGGEPRAGVAKEIRGPVEQFLRLIVPGFIGHVRQPVPRVPFADSAPDIIVYTR